MSEVAFVVGGEYAVPTHHHQTPHHQTINQNTSHGSLGFAVRQRA